MSMVFLCASEQSEMSSTMASTRDTRLTDGRAPAERLLWPGRASPSAHQILAFSPGKDVELAGPLGTLLGLDRKSVV